MREQPKSCEACVDVRRQPLQSRRSGVRPALETALIQNLALQQQKLDLELAFDAVPFIFVAFTSDKRIAHWNAAACRTFGLSAEQVYGKQLVECGIEWQTPHTLDVLFQNDPAEQRSDQPFLLHGQKRWLGLSVRRAESENGRSAFLLTASDITVRRERDEQSRQTNKLEAIGQLAAGIAHEINTPVQYVADNITFLRDAWDGLAAVVNAAQALRQQAVLNPTSAPLLQAYDHAVHQADLSFMLSEFPGAMAQSLEGTERIAHIVRAMKEFSHPGSKEKTDLDLNHAIETTLVISRSEWKYVADVQTDFDPTLPAVTCYPGEISQVILNLLVNAAHTIHDKTKKLPDAPKGTITLRTLCCDKGAQVLVTDTGMGIPEAIRPRIFDMFFTTKEVGKGTGQGLAFVHSVIVKKHGGDLWCDSEVGVGTTFGFRLPFAATA